MRNRPSTVATMAAAFPDACRCRRHQRIIWLIVRDSPIRPIVWTSTVAEISSEPRARLAIMTAGQADASLLDRLHIGDDGRDLVRLEGELRHGRVRRHDPLGERLLQV